MDVAELGQARLRCGEGPLQGCTANKVEVREFGGDCLARAAKLIRPALALRLLSKSCSQVCDAFLVARPYSVPSKKVHAIYSRLTLSAAIWSSGL
jgi:hypothetical protein